MVVLALRVILVFFVVKANVASPSTEARFKDEAKFKDEARNGETQESPLSLYFIKYIQKIKTVVMERIENIENEFAEKLASLKGGLSSSLDDVMTDVRSKFKGTAYYYTPNHAHCCT